MNLLPVIERELRSQARHASTYWGRVLAALILTVVFGLGMSIDQSGTAAWVGGRLFLALNGAVYYVIWVGVPLLAADAISSEKREGTLGLLFLTPLGATDIVAGKGLILAVRSLALLLAGLPVLLLPLILGGVSRSSVLFMATFHLLSLLMALAAGLTASSLSRQPVRALMGGLALSLMMSIAVNMTLVGISSGEALGLWFGPKAIEDALDWVDGNSGFSMGLWLCVCVAGVLIISGVLLFQVVRQVEAFWQEAPAGVGRTRSAARRWVRALAGLLVMVAAVVVCGVMLENQVRGFMVFMGLNALVLCLIAWFGGVAWVIRHSADAGVRELARHGWKAPVESSRIEARRRWWRLGGRPGGLVRVLVSSFVFVLVLAVATELIPWTMAIAMLLNPASALLLSMAVGSLAWAWGRTWMRAIARAALLGVPMFLLWCLAFAVLVAHVMVESRQATSMNDMWEEGVHIVFFVGSVVGSGCILVFGDDMARHVNMQSWLWDTIVLLVLSAVVALVLGFVAHWLEARPRRRPVGEEAGVSLAADLAEPVVWKGFVRRRKKRVLNRNPMRWLLERSRTSRLHRVGWLTFVALGEMVMVVQERTLSEAEAWSWQSGILFLLSLGLAVASALSFQEEKRTGAMELILVTPLRARQIIAGRWIGLLSQFLPSFVLLMLVSGLASGIGWVGGRDYEPVFMAGLVGGLVGFTAVPVVGMLCALKFKHVLTGCLITAMVPLVAGLVFLGWRVWVRMVLGGWTEVSSGDAVVGGLLWLSSVGLGWLAFQALERRLERREAGL